MIKLLQMLTRKEGMPVEAFQARWHDEHAPVFVRVPGLRRYVQTHPIASIYGEYTQAFDGLTEAWFDSLEEFEDARRSEEWRAAEADASEFADRIASMLVTEVPVIDALPSPRERESMVKYVGFLTRRPELSIEQFQQHWREVHGPLVVAELQGMRRYVQSHALRETYGSDFPPAFDGAPEAWFDSLEVFPRRLGRREGPATTPGTIDSENVFIQPILSITAREVVIVD